MTLRASSYESLARAMIEVWEEHQIQPTQMGENTTNGSKNLHNGKRKHPINLKTFILLKDRVGRNNPLRELTSCLVLVIQQQLLRMRELPGREQTRPMRSNKVVRF